jgi:RNA polymerase sigma factor (sigma-70 family)
MTDEPERSSAVWVARARDAYDAVLYREIRRRIRNEHDVRDLAQEVWARLLLVQDVERIRKPLAFIRIIAKHVIVDFYRRRGGEPIDYDSSTMAKAGDRLSYATYDDFCGQDLARKAFEALPASYRQIFILHEHEGWSYEAIATHLNFTVGTVRQYHSRAIARMLEFCSRDPGSGNGNDQRR